jgi:hypothetical protein
VSWPCSSGSTASESKCDGTCTLGYNGGTSAYCVNTQWTVVGSCAGEPRVQASKAAETSRLLLSCQVDDRKEHEASLLHTTHAC